MKYEKCMHSITNVEDSQITGQCQHNGFLIVFSQRCFAPILVRNSDSTAGCRLLAASDPEFGICKSMLKRVFFFRVVLHRTRAIFHHSPGASPSYVKFGIKMVCVSTMTILSDVTAWAPRNAPTLCGRGKSKSFGILTSPKLTENSSHQTENHLMSRNVLPSGSDSVMSLLRYRFITPVLPRSSRKRKAPWFWIFFVLPT